MASTKVAWLVQNSEKARALMAANKLRYGSLDTWLLFRLSGDRFWGSDRSNVSAGGFYDPWTDGPNGLVFSLLKLPASLYMGCEKPSSGLWAETPAAMFFGRSIPVVTVVSDQGAAHMGECCFSEGEAKVTLGSGAFLSCTTGFARKGKRGG